MDPRAHVLSCGVQALGLRSEWGAPLQVRQRRLRWKGELQPSAYSRAYEVEIDYRLGHHPDVRVVTPALEPNSEGWLPHFYHHKNTLCLYDDGEWYPSLHLAWTIVPWTIEWLFQYEIWKVTDIWHGSGDDMVWANITPLPAFDTRDSRRTRRRQRVAA
jgi:hypothetical protein